MQRRKVVWSIVVVALLAIVWIGQALSQEGGQQRPAREGRAQQRRQWNPERMRQRMLERVKEALSAADKEMTEEEWKILQPKIVKVQTLSGQTTGMGGMARMGRRRPGGGERPAEGAEPTRKLTDVEKMAQDLQKSAQQLQAALDNKDAKLGEIKQKLTALRAAREKVKQESAKAQKALRDILTLRQEAQLVLMGLLD